MNEQEISLNNLKDLKKSVESEIATLKLELEAVQQEKIDALNRIQAMLGDLEIEKEKARAAEENAAGLGKDFEEMQNALNQVC